MADCPTAAAVAKVEAAKAKAAKGKVGPRLQPLAARIESEFPAASREILFAGIERLADYQDVAYAAEYLKSTIHWHIDGVFDEIRHIWAGDAFGIIHVGANPTHRKPERTVPLHAREATARPAVRMQRNPRSSAP